MMYLDGLKEQMLGQTMVECVCNGLRERMDGFTQIEGAYQKTRKKIGEKDGEQLGHLISRQAGMVFFFSAVQGLRMNWTHFYNPMSPTCIWKQVDYRDCLRPELVLRLPAYMAAEQALDVFLGEISEDAHLLEAVTDYRTAIETAGSKLAHYYGYLFGNEILPYCLPGYYEDFLLSAAYKEMLESYFGEEQKGTANSRPSS